MADTGFVIAGTGANNTDIGTEAWSSPGNITADDGSDATGSSAAQNEQMNYLVGSNFGLSVPAGSTIDGIEARLQASDNQDLADITHVIVGKDNSTLGNDLEAGSTNVSSTPTNYDYGGATQLWGLSWTAAEVNASTFQVRISMNADATGKSGAGNPAVDFIAVKVYYTPAVGLTQFHIIG